MKKITKTNILKEITAGANSIKNIYAFTGSDKRGKIDMENQIKSIVGESNIIEINGLKELRSSFILKDIAKSKSCIIHTITTSYQKKAILIY